MLRSMSLSLTAPPAPPSLAPAASSSHDYFEQLDQAFANLAGAKSSESTNKPPAAPPGDIDWYPKRN